MNIKKALFLGVISTVLLTAGFAHAAATADNRYFVKSTSQFWKKSLNVRNTFDGGFSTDLNDWQLKLTKVFGVQIQPIKKLNILGTTAPTASPSPTPLVTGSPVPTTPVNSVDWGVRLMYGNSLEGLPSGGKDVTVAILDTGAAVNHPDLQARIVGCADFSSGTKIVNDSCTDQNGHGTHVAGIVAADGGTDGEGIYGMAPDTSLLIYKVCADDGTCYADDVAAAIRYAVDQHANIILLSIGTDTDSGMIDDAINYASAHNVMLVAAAGNDGPDSNGIDFPASNAAVVSVGALDADILVPDWSSRGNNKTSKTFVKEAGDIEFVAPGVNVQSTWKDGHYAISSGTSMAAAHVAGLAAREWQFDSAHPVKSTLDILHKFADDILPLGDDSASGWGVPRL